jgi:hypothetical protein
VWVTKLLLAVLAISAAVWMGRKAWLSANPERKIANLEARLLQNLRKRRSEEAISADWMALCGLVKQGIDDKNPTLAHRGTEVIKLFVGEFFSSWDYSPRLTARIYRNLASLYAAAIKSHQETAIEIMVALRVAARELLGKNDAAFHELVRQFTLYGLLALRERQFFAASKILDQLFMLVPKRAYGVTTASGILLEAIGILGQAAVKRHDLGLIREIVARLLRVQEMLGRDIHHPIYQILLKSVRAGSSDMIDLALEASKNIFDTEKPGEAVETMKIWTEAAKTALTNQDDVIAGKCIRLLVTAAQERLEERQVVVGAVDNLFDIMGLAVRQRDVKTHGELLIPVLELGYYCMQRELKHSVVSSTLQSNQSVLKYLLDKLLLLGAMLTRDGNLTTGGWTVSLYQKWIMNPEYAYRKQGILKFMQLWLLYWASNQRRSAKRQGGIPSELFTRESLSAEEMARFPELHLRKCNM